MGEQDLRDVLLEELIYLWGDFADAYRASRTDPPETSMGCEHLIGRIQTVTKLVGPIDPAKVAMPFLLTGMYERVHAEIGITVTVPEVIMQQAREYVANGKLEASRG